MDLNTIQALGRPRVRHELPAWRDGDAYLAGGTWLFSEPQPTLSRLIDLGGLGWAPLAHDTGGQNVGGLRIAATCTFAELAGAAFAWPSAPLFAQCCRALLGSFKIWNAATVGGNLCLALPAGPMAALTTALDGACLIWTTNGGERWMRVPDFITGANRNALRPGEILREIFLPAPALHRRTAFRQISLTPLGRSGALLVGTIGADGFVLTVTASTTRPVQLQYSGMPDAATLQARLDADIPASLWHDDVHGMPEWRRQVTHRLAEEIRRELAG